MSAIAAKRRKVPIFHMEAGNRCFDERVPEEIIRKIIDHIADINLPYSDIARNILIKEGINPKRQLLLCLTDSREIPLTGIEQPMALNKIEDEAIKIAKYLNVFLETE